MISVMIRIYRYIDIGYIVYCMMIHGFHDCCNDCHDEDADDDDDVSDDDADYGDNDDDDDDVSDDDDGDNDDDDEEMFFLVRSAGFLLTCEEEMVRPYMETHSRPSCEVQKHSLG